MVIICFGTQYREVDTEDWVIIAELLQGRSFMQLYRDLPLLTCFEFLKEAVIADFRWLFDMNNISVIENGFSTASLGFRI
ncbi:MAG: hypothetical protein CMI09_13485 [Oceanospirillaceae bacterium]|nr:hypothetical protein [Oceanospirillaceae bacterium]|tara:strand:+ start:84 stop:323 length:240 start_codon:yes stop_codon:yes gene_type:complete